MSLDHQNFPRIKKRTQRPRLHNWQALSEALHQETRDSPQPKAKKSPYGKKKISPDPIQMSVDDLECPGGKFSRSRAFRNMDRELRPTVVNRNKKG